LADRTPERTQSHAHAVLRRSSKRLLLFIEGEIARSGGGSVTLYNDQFAVVVRSRSFLHAAYSAVAITADGDRIQVGPRGFLRSGSVWLGFQKGDLRPRKGPR
jgi:hypothetical protein